GAVALLSLGFLVLRPRPVPPPIDSTVSALTIAVLPFTVRGPGLEIWREGMVDLLSIGLDGAAGVRAINSRTLLARWHQEIGDTNAADLESALNVARRSNARYALVGAVVAAGPRLRLSADIYDVATGRVVAPVEVEGSADSVLVLVDRVGMQTLGVILEKNAGEVPTLDLADFTTNSLFALKAYLEGEDHYRRSEFPAAITAWERAVRADTFFALAKLGLADAYAWVGSYTQFTESLDGAKAMAGRLPGRERAMMEIRWERLNGVPEVVPTIREALRKYPDAADVWYQLGEVYFHDAVGTGRPEDAEAAFRRAVALQPTMAPYQEHLLDLSFLWHPDSAHISRELAAYTRLAPQAVATKAGRIVFALEFGDSAARARADSELGTLDSEAAVKVYSLLLAPFFAELRGRVYRALAPRLKQADLASVQGLRFKNLGLADGRVREALAMLGEPRIPVYVRYGGPLYLSVRGMPVPERVLTETLAAAQSDSSLFSNRIAAMFAAGTAARLGDWAGYNEIVSRMRALAARGRSVNDAATAEYWNWAVRAAEAHSLWRHGRKEEALRRFESTLGADPGWFSLWEIGELSLELGRLDQAERAFRALWQADPTASTLQLARILERGGRAAEARDAYRSVADAWREADPELQPLVDEARRAVVRLSDAPD
ncbi:MAG: tetratricopeptide repeat protein, partial [Gemmatimonadota bacterium]